MGIRSVCQRLGSGRTNWKLENMGQIWLWRRFLSRLVCFNLELMTQQSLYTYYFIIDIYIIRMLDIINTFDWHCVMAIYFNRLHWLRVTLYVVTITHFTQCEKCGNYLWWILVFLTLLAGYVYREFRNSQKGCCDFPIPQQTKCFWYI